MDAQSAEDDELKVFTEFREPIINSVAFALTIIAVITVLTQSTKIFDLSWVWVIVAGIAAFLAELFRALMRDV